MKKSKKAKNFEKGTTQIKQLKSPAKGFFLNSIKESNYKITSLIFLVGIILAYFVILIKTAWVCDDAYITFRTVDNLVNGYGLTWNISERVQSFTHPLWLFVFSAIYYFTREAFVSSILLSITISLSTIILFSFKLAKEHLIAIIGITIIIFSRSFIDYSTSGLENPLSIFLIAIFLLMFFKFDFNFKTIFLLSLISCLVTLNRMDLILVFIPPLGYALIKYKKISSIFALILGFMPFFFWEIFSLLYYGFFVPNTAYAKMNTGIENVEYYEQGIFYFLNSLKSDPITLPSIFVGISLTFISKNKRAISVIIGMILYLIYIIKIGGDFMSGRFFIVPLFISLATIVSLNIRIKLFAKIAVLLVITLFGLIFASPNKYLSSNFGSSRLNSIDERGICDERKFYFNNASLKRVFDGIDQPNHEFVKVGKQLRAENYPIIIGGAIGYEGYFAGPKVYIIDYHALSDPLLSKLPMVECDSLYLFFYQSILNKQCPFKWRIGHFYRSIPKGYVETILTGNNLIEDRNLAEYYNRISLITRGTIFDWNRIKEIININLGNYDYLIDKSIYSKYTRTPDINNIILKYKPELLPKKYLGNLYFEKGEYEKAIDAFKTIIVVDSTNTEALGGLGACFGLLGDYDKSIYYLETSIQKDSTNYVHHKNLGAFYLRINENRKAINAWTKCLLLAPKNSSDYLQVKNALDTLMMSK